jgi:hypothetical protein
MEVLEGVPRAADSLPALQDNISRRVIALALQCTRVSGWSREVGDNAVADEACV